MTFRCDCGLFIGLRVFLSHWLLKGIGHEVTELRRELEAMRREVASLRSWVYWGNRGESR